MNTSRGKPRSIRREQGMPAARRHALFESAMHADRFAGIHDDLVVGYGDGPLDGELAAAAAHRGYPEMGLATCARITRPGRARGTASAPSEDLVRPGRTWWPRAVRVDPDGRLCVELARLDHPGEQSGNHPEEQAADHPRNQAGDNGEANPRPPGTPRSREALQQAIIGKAAGLLSGPGGLASFLRTRQLGARLAGPSLPLDVGVSKDIPAAIRRAVLLRARHCEWAGRCDQPAAVCEVHHVRHKSDGGTTSVRDCVLLCFFHHQVVIHRWRWTLVLNPDGTTTAWNPGKTKVLHSHGPPARPG